MARNGALWLLAYMNGLLIVEYQRNLNSVMKLSLDSFVGNTFGS